MRIAHTLIGVVEGQNEPELIDFSFHTRKEAEAAIEKIEHFLDGSQYCLFATVIYRTIMYKSQKYDTLDTMMLWGSKIE